MLHFFKSALQHAAPGGQAAAAVVADGGSGGSGGGTPAGAQLRRVTRAAAAAAAGAGVGVDAGASPARLAALPSPALGAACERVYRDILAGDCEVLRLAPPLGK
jgi:hypothetical protein